MPNEPTREYQVKMLRKLKGWLDQNPKNNPIVASEAAALAWVLKEIGEE